MKKQIVTRKKFRLTVETLRRLSGVQLERMSGGLDEPADGSVINCPTLAALFCRPPDA
jgi:hypothetical protein